MTLKSNAGELLPDSYTRIQLSLTVSSKCRYLELCLTPALADSGFARNIGKIDIDMIDLLRWCKEKGRNNIGGTREKCISEQVKKLHLPKKNN
jgi:hypothetical protein